MRRTHLSGDKLELLDRRAVLLMAVTWLPLLILTLIEGHAWAGSVLMPFLGDIGSHVRFLVAMPLLLGAELVAFERMRFMPGEFLLRDLIPPEKKGVFINAVKSAM